MSEVQRFWSHEASNIRCVREADFDRVTAERDAALADLASASSDKEAYAQNAIDLRKRVDALQQRLTAADERATMLEQMVADYPEVLFERCTFSGKNSDGSDAFQFSGDAPFKKLKSIRMIGWLCKGPADNKAEPAEGGGDDRTKSTR